MDRHSPKRIRPIRLHQALGGLPLPASRKKIIEYVRTKNTDSLVLEHALMLPEDIYHTEAEILTALHAFEPHTVTSASQRDLPEKLSVPQKMRMDGLSLIVVTGHQCARFYEVREKKITLLESIKIPTERFSDNEGHFKVRMSGGTVRSGAPRESDRRHAQRKFIHSIVEYLQRVHLNDVRRVYICTPAYIKNELLGALPNTLLDKLTLVIEKNYFNTHPVTLYGIIHEATASSDEDARRSEEADRIVKRSHIAQKVIGGKR